MGRRSVNTTKSGKFMNPTDQARKEARKKELKKNKKQRLLVRTAVLKNKDPGQIINELDKLDEIEYNPTQAPALAEKVLKDKRKKLRETLERVMKLYQKEDLSYWTELKRVEQDYERRRFHRIQYFEAVKQAENTAVEDIPLPEMGPGGTSGLPGAPGGSSSIADIPLPGEFGETGEIHGILKKSVPQIPVALPPPIPTFQGREPPGVPPGPPPDLSDMDDYSEDEDEDDEQMEVEPEAAVQASNKPKSVRFQGDDKEGGDNKALSEMDRFMREIEEESKQLEEEEDLLPPGTEPGSGSIPLAPPKPKAAAAEVPQVSSSDRTVSPPPTTSATESPKVPSSSVPPPPLPDQPPPPMMSVPPPGIRIPPPVAAAPPPPVHQFYPPPPPSMAMGQRMRFPPPPPIPMPPMRAQGGGFGMPPGRPPPAYGGHGLPSHGGPRFRPQSQRPNNVFSSAPQIIKSDNKIVSETMIQAKPQIRSLSADVTRFVPSIIKQKRDEFDKPKRHEYQIGQSQAAARSLQQQQTRQPGPSKDDAYAEFMKEMSGLM